MSSSIVRKKERSINMTDGAIMPAIIRFCIPLIISGFLQCAYNAADLIIIGKFESEDALASVGATGPVTGLTINLFISLAVGSSILFARAYGARDGDRIKSLISTAYTFSLLLGVGVTLLGELIAVPLLKISACPEGAVFDGAELYLRIVLLGCPAQLFYNFMCDVIRADGDSTRPLVYLTVSGLLNIVLNYVLVVWFGLGVCGVAVATVVAQYCSALLLFIRLVRFDGVKHLNPFSFSINGSQLKRILRFGIPSAISNSMYSIANFQIMSAINAFGSYATAGNAAATNIETFFTTMSSSLTTASSAFVGQNIGAGNRERVSKAVKQMYLFAAPLLGTVGLLAPIFGDRLMSLYLQEGSAAALEFGTVRLWCVSAFLFLCVFMNINTGTLQAFGYTTYCMLISILGVCGFRMLWMLCVYPHIKTPLGIYSCFTVSWFLVATIGTVTVAVVKRRYLKNKLNI